MKNIDWKSLIKKTLPHIGAIAVMYLFTLVYFSPVCFDNKTITQSDMVNFIGTSHEAQEFHKETGEYSGWTNAMFSGMPTESLYSQAPFNVFDKISIVFRGGFDYHTAGMMFSYLIGFYIFMVCIGCSAWLSLLGAIVYAFCSYNFIIIEAGHVTKGYAMAFIAPLLGGIILSYRKKYLAGFIVTLLFLGIEISRNHLQITYYAALMVICFAIGFFIQYLVKYIKEKESFIPFWKASGVLLLAAILSLGPNMANLYSNYVFSKDTIRGGSELSIKPNSDTNTVSSTPNESGLEIDYAYAWSYGKMESFTLLVPNMYGSGHTVLEKGDPTIQQLRQVGYGSTYLPTYWGDQPFTSGPVYAGAVVCLLFILGLFVVKGPEKWILLATFIISLMLAWGKNFMPFNEWTFHHLPLYNKFRAPSMALIIAGVAMPMLGMLALKNIFSEDYDKKKAWKHLRYSLYITGGLCLLIMLLGSTVFSFVGANDAQFQNQLASAGFDRNGINNVMDILYDYRKSMLMKDAIRSLIFIILAFVAITLHLKGKTKKTWIPVVILCAITLFDMWPVAKRYLNNSDFVSKKKTESNLEATQANKIISMDPDINFRVANFTSSTFNDAQTSYYHKSIGGYSGVKLRRYQDIIDFYLQNEIRQGYAAIVNAQGIMEFVNPDQIKVLSMLNTKYFILAGRDGQTIPLENPYRYGNAWFVDHVQWVENADEEILSLKSTDLKHVAIVDRRFSDRIIQKAFDIDSTATIVNTLCKPNRLQYKFNASREQLVVFSEVFYEKGGWDVTIDGQPAKHFRADYLLRAMIVPAGSHDIEFTYTPHARLLGCKISNITSAICIIIMLLGVVLALKPKQKAQ